MTGKEVLVKVKELLSDPSRWTKRAFGRTADGRGVMGYDPDATCWCLAGAIHRVGLGRAAIEAFDILSDKVGNVAAFNDGVTHEKMMKMLEEVTK